MTTRDKYSRILVFRFGGLGDYVCMMPMLKALRSAFPGAEITALVGSPGTEILSASGGVDRIIVSRVLSDNGWKSVISLGALQDILRLITGLKGRFDLYIDATPKFSMLGVLKPWLVKIVAAPVLSIGLGCGERRLYLDKAVPQRRDERRHLLFKYADLMELVGVDMGGIIPQMEIPSETLSKARQFFDRSPRQLKIGLHPGANRRYYRIKAWPIERFAALARMLKAEYDCGLFATAAPDETQLVEKLIAAAGVEITAIPASQSLLELCAYLKCLDCYVSNDTGPMHLAVACGVPTVGIFGHADHETYGSYPSEVKFEPVIIDGGVKNSSRVSKGDPRRLLDISPEMVLRPVKRLLSPVGNAPI